MKICNRWDYISCEIVSKECGKNFSLLAQFFKLTKLAQSSKIFKTSNKKFFTFFFQKKELLCIYGVFKKRYFFAFFHDFPKNHDRNVFETTPAPLSSPMDVGYWYKHFRDIFSSKSKLNREILKIYSVLRHNKSLILYYICFPAIFHHF